MPPFRADHVGSLLRPQSVLGAREAFAAGRMPAEELGAVEDDAIRAMVKAQEDVGLQSATDGALRRAAWHMDFIYQLGAIRPTDDRLQVEFHHPEGTIPFQAAALCI